MNAKEEFIYHCVFKASIPRIQLCENKHVRGKKCLLTLHANTTTVQMRILNTLTLTHTHTHTRILLHCINVINKFEAQIKKK